MRTIRFIDSMLLGPMFLCACGEPKANPTIAQAVQTENSMEKGAEALAAKERAEREAQARARRELEEQRSAELDAATALPAELPQDLADACDGLLTAHDEFMKRGNERDVLAWHDGRRKALGQRRTRCINIGSIEVAACEIEALQAEFTSMIDIPREDTARMVSQRCLDKFGS